MAVSPFDPAGLPDERPESGAAVAIAAGGGGPPADGICCAAKSSFGTPVLLDGGKGAP